MPVVMISGHGNVETAVSAIQRGAYDYIEKPFKVDRLLLHHGAPWKPALKREIASCASGAPRPAIWSASPLPSSSSGPSRSRADQ